MPMFFRRLLRITKDFIISLGRVGMSLAISAVSLVLVISLAFLFYLIFKEGLGIDNAFLGSLSLIAGFLLYVGIVGWFAWRYIRRKFQI